MHPKNTPKTITFACEICGKVTTKKLAHYKRSNHHFCGMSCYGKYQQRHPHGGKDRAPARQSVSLTCKVCGKAFRENHRRRHRVYCSTACYSADHTTLKTCNRCGKPFRVPNSRNGQVYCSMACKMAEVPIENCERCGKPFRMSNKHRRHCSEECRRPPIILTCEQCGIDFRCVPTEAVGREGKAGRRFCSFSCYRRFTGETAPERAVRRCLDALGIAYVQEHQVGTFSIDFFIPALRLAIEVDEPYWHKPIAEKDARRDSDLLTIGIKTERLDATPFYGPLSSKMMRIVRRTLARHVTDLPTLGESASHRLTCPTSGYVYVQQSLIE